MNATYGYLRSMLLVFVFALGLPPALSAAQPMVDVLISFRSVPGPAEQALVRSHGGSISRSFTLVPAVAARIPAAALRGLEMNPHVTAVEVDGQFYAISTDAELNNTWGVKRIGGGTLHAADALGAGVRIAVIDSGIDYRHPDLAANYAGGFDFVNSDNDPMDDNGHGTHVAGTVAAVRNGSGVVGAAPAARIYGLKTLSASGSGSFSNMIAALEWCVQNGIQITNNSYGSSQDPGTIVQQAYDNAAAAGILHIAAAGNTGTVSGRGNNVGWPARYDSVVAVAATTSADARASFSSTGPAVELAAPGVGINSTLAGGGYGSYNGTSMAAPHVAGVAGLLLGLAPDIHPRDLRAILQQTALDLGAAGRDPHFGFGLVDAEAAVLALAGSEPPSPPPPPPEVAPLSIANVSSAVTNAKNGSFEITWTTNVPASSVVRFTSGGTGTQTNSTLKTSHRMTFKGSKGVTYTFMVEGTSAEGVTAESGPHVHQN
jgi:subtilisin